MLYPMQGKGLGLSKNAQATIVILNALLDVIKLRNVFASILTLLVEEEQAIQ